MPTYEFRCSKGHEFERFYKTISAGVSELPCPECGATATRQLSGGGGLVFKGSGFYLTDYGKNAHRGSAPKRGEGAKAEGATTDSAKADSAKAEGGKTEGAKSESKTESREPKAESRERKAESREPKAESREKKTESSKPKPKSE